jgi:hypothetical protein
VLGFTVLRLTGLSFIGDQKSQNARLAGFASKCRAVEGSKTSKLKSRSTVGIGELGEVFKELHRTAFELA